MDNDAGRYRRFLDGDDDGLREIIDEHYSGLTLYINSIIHDVSQTEEVIQDTFVKLAVKKPKFSGRKYFKTWLYCIAKHCALDYIRKSARMTPLPIDEAFQLSDEADIEKQYLKEEQKIELHRAMKRLKTEYAQVLYLMYFEDFDTIEISKIMHKAKRQVSDLIYRARKSLRSELEKVGFTYEKY